MILYDILEARKKRTAAEGSSQGITLPEKRDVPVIPFVHEAGPGGNNKFVIAEVKRKSPSAGIISENFSHLAAAESYISNGIKNISILTEQDYFGGSLSYLMDIKNKYPRISVLRKDFLYTLEDIDVSYRAGADAVLLIASVLEKSRIEELYRYAEKYGMEVLVEVHSRSDISKVSGIKPSLTGINTRDLETFRIDRLLPLKLAPFITWPSSVVYESGIRNSEDAELAFASGFTAVLCGETVMKNSSLAGEMIKLAEKPRKLMHSGDNYFWRQLYSGKKQGRPLVKICGITNREDALAAVECGADILGFIFAPSPRMAPPELPDQLADLNVLKTAVAVDPSPELASYIKDIYARGLIHAVQFHGNESPEFCSSFGMPYYKALGYDADASAVSASGKAAASPAAPSVYNSPRILSDAGVKGKSGGTGVMIDPQIIKKIKADSPDMPLWLAGGLSDENISMAVKEFEPELVDASSRLEISPGRKDHRKLKRFFIEMEKQ